MTAKEYLSQIKLINVRIEALSEQLEHLQSAAQYVSPQISNMPKSPTRNTHRMEDAIIRVLDWQEKIKAEYAKLNEINEAISKVSSPIAQAILVKRYIKSETWDVIMRELYISRSRLFELHNAALDEIEKADLANRLKPL